jgi:hypothetical protein
VKAPQPDNESTRMATLQSLEILDTLPEQTYDDITYLASQLVDAPIALITLVDADRQWFKSCLGLDVQETPRDHAFCAHAILDPKSLLVVPNATEDRRFADNPLVTGPPHIRFYAGAPLVYSDGSALGTLCVIDSEPHAITPLQKQSLRVLARQVVAQMELRKTLSDVKELRGVVPMCAHCKQVRDDAGFWKTVEKYIQENSEVMVSHGICPKCMKQQFPSFSAKMDQDEAAGASE